MGAKAVVDNTHWGMLYQNEILRPLRKGRETDRLYQKSP